MPPPVPALDRMSPEITFVEEYSGSDPFDDLSSWSDDDNLPSRLSADEPQALQSTQMASAVDAAVAPHEASS